MRNTRVNVYDRQLFKIKNQLLCMCIAYEQHFIEYRVQKYYKHNINNIICIYFH